MEAADIIAYGGKFVFQSLMNGNKEEIIEILNYDVLDMEVNINNQKIIGNHTGTRKLVQQGSCLQISCLKLKPNYVAQPNGSGQFISEQFTYSGLFLNGVFHDNTGEAFLVIGETQRYIGMFKSGLKSGVGKLEEYNFELNQWQIKQDGFWENNEFKDRKNLKINKITQEIKQEITIGENVKTPLKNKNYELNFLSKYIDNPKSLKKVVGSLQRGSKTQDNLNIYQKIIMNFNKDKIQQFDIKIISDSFQYTDCLLILDISFKKQDLSGLDLSSLQKINKIQNLNKLILDLSFTNIKELKFIQLNELQKLKELQINLSNNQLSDVNSLCEIIQDLKQLNILSLNLSNNQKIPQNQYIEILQILQQFEKLQELNLFFDFNEINDQIIDDMINLFQIQTQLYKLRLSLYNCKLSQESILKLSDCFLKSQTIKDIGIYLHNNKLDPKIKEQLTEDMNNCKNFTKKIVNF